MTTPTDPAPAPGPDTPRWTVDDDPTFGPRLRWPGQTDVLERSDLPFGGPDQIIAYAHLVADVDAARVHEGCTRELDEVRSNWQNALARGRYKDSVIERLTREHEGCAHTTDTLRQAREIVARFPMYIPVYAAWHKELQALVDLLVDGGGDG
jgi:predicted Fe-S protein YdhL (DUF1289 family)